MADKKALFAGRSGDRDSSPSQRSASTSSSTATPSSTSRSTKAAVSYNRGGALRGVAVSAERRAAQLKEAEEHRKAANRCLQKTMTRWNPNYFKAAPLFEKAAACYRTAGEDTQAISMFMTAGECQSHDSVLAHPSAAKDFKEAAIITQRQGREEEAATLYMRCAEAWINADESGRAGEYLGRSAKLVEESDEDTAVERYLQASKVMVPDGCDITTNFVRVIGGTEVMMQAIRYLASARRLEECLKVLDRFCILLESEGIQHSLNRMFLSHCVVLLSLGDYVRADRSFRDIHLQNTAYLRSEECRLEEDLLTAFKNFDAELLRRTQRDRTFRHLESPIIRLAIELVMPGEEDIIPARSGIGNLSDVAQRVGALKDEHQSADPTLPQPSNTDAVSPCPPARQSSDFEVEASTTSCRDVDDHAEGVGDAAEDKLFERRRAQGVKMSQDLCDAQEAGQSALDSINQVDLGLDDLEHHVAFDAGDGGGNLDDIIEAARREAEGISLGNGEMQRQDPTNDDEVDLT